MDALPILSRIFARYSLKPFAVDVLDSRKFFARTNWSCNWLRSFAVPFSISATDICGNCPSGVPILSASDRIAGDIWLSTGEKRFSRLLTAESSRTTTRRRSAVDRSRISYASIDIRSSIDFPVTSNILHLQSFNREQFDS